MSPGPSAELDTHVLEPSVIFVQFKLCKFIEEVIYAFFQPNKYIEEL